MEIIRVNETEYEIERLLGKGKGGYSYLARNGGKAAVVKQIHHEPCSYYRFGDKLAAELRDYERLRSVGIPMPVLLDVDRENERLVKEFISGETIFELVRRDAVTREHFAQVEAMCALLYPAGLNIDYFPTNFVVDGGRLFYVDYECNDYMEQWDFAHWGIRYWSKTPEFEAYLAECST